MLAHGIDAIREHLDALPPAASLGIDALRAYYDKAEAVFPLPSGVTVEEADCGGVPAELLWPAAHDRERVLYYLHGGGYALGSPRSHRHMVAALAVACACPALLVDYRRAPEHPFPAAVDDALTAYRWILDQGYAAEKVAIAGDSAGGGLTAATLVGARDAGLPLPGAAVLISPWCDLTSSAATFETKAAADPLVNAADIARWASCYLGDTPATHPLASPLFADLAGLPSLLIHAGSEEVLLDDSRRLANRAEAAGVEVTLEIWEGMIHVWHWFGPYLDEAPAAIDRIAEFVSARTR